MDRNCGTVADGQALAPRDKRLINLGGRAPTYFAALHFRDLPETKPEPDTPPPATEPAEVEMQPNSGTPTPEAQTAEAEAKLAEATKALEAAVQDAEFADGLTDLNESYAKLLNRLLKGDDKALARRELDRLEAGLPMEEVDPARLPPRLKRARAVYRENMVTLKKARDRRAISTLQEHATTLESMEREFEDAGKTVAAEKIAEARATFEPRLADLGPPEEKSAYAEVSGPESTFLQEARQLEVLFLQQCEEASRPVTDLQQKFVNQLETKAAAAGAVAAAAYRDQIAALEADQITPVPASPTELKRLREIYDRQIAPLRQNYGRRVQPIIVTYLERLETLLERMTASNDTAAPAVEAEIEAKSEMLSKMVTLAKEAQDEDVLFSDDFSGETLGTEWFDETDSLQIENGKVIATENNSVMNLSKSFSGNFRIEVDLEKDGTVEMKGWDFRIGLIKPGTFGAILFDVDDLDQISLEGVTDDSEVSASTEGSGRNKGTAILAYRSGKTRFSFKTSRGTVETDWVDTPPFDETQIRLSLAGGGEESPRKIDELRVFRLRGR